MVANNSSGSLRPATFSVEQAAEILGICRSLAFNAAATGELPVIRIGKRLLVPRAALERLLGGPIPDTPEATSRAIRKPAGASQ